MTEPFEAWYDKKSGKSRNDFYGDLYKIYQFGPSKKEQQQQQQEYGNNNVFNEDYGVMYKLAYVPASFHPELRTSLSENNNDSNKHNQQESLINRMRDVISSHLPNIHHHHNNKNNSKVALSLDGGDNKKQQDATTRRACFKVDGGVGFTIGPQSVLPDMTDFTFHSRAECPHGDREDMCEIWKKVTSMGDKVNTYKMWLLRDRNEPDQVIPLFYSMTGYNNVFGSHYDRYDIVYHHFVPGGARNRDFHFDEGENHCGPMPGPGFAAAAAAGDDNIKSRRRAHMIAQNPFHEYIDEPHRYDHVDHEFEKFAKQHDKQYESNAHLHKGWHNFLHNLRFINSKNRQLQTYKLAVNKFADNNQRDLSYLRGRIQTKKSGESNGGLDYAQHHKSLKNSNGSYKQKLPDSWDWTIRGAVTPVKDQAVCGSCWSFGTSGTVEGAYFVKTGKLLRLSQQQMIDCSWPNQNNGCDGGEDFRAYQYIMKAGGLATEEDYGHYMGVDGKCHDLSVKKAAQISGWYNVTVNDREALKHAIVTYGPVSVSIDASQPTFTFYSHGVYYDEKCNNNPDGLDHAVLAVGYTELDGKFVWQVKNSWSTNWGNNGYIMMSAEKNNCGVMDAPTVPIIKVQA